MELCFKVWESPFWAPFECLFFDMFSRFPTYFFDCMKLFPFRPVNSPTPKAEKPTGCDEVEKILLPFQSMA